MAYSAHFGLKMGGKKELIEAGFDEIERQVSSNCMSDCSTFKFYEIRSDRKREAEHKNTKQAPFFFLTETALR
jgi:hypothetical protein